MNSYNPNQRRRQARPPHVARAPHGQVNRGPRAGQKPWIHASLDDNNIRIPTWVKEISSPHFATLESLAYKFFKLEKVVENLEKSSTVVKSCRISNKPSFAKEVAENFDGRFKQHVNESEKALHKIVIEGKKAELDHISREVHTRTEPEFYRKMILEHVTSIRFIAPTTDEVLFMTQALQEVAFNIVTHANLIVQQEVKKRAEKAAKLEEARRRIDNMTNREAFNFALKRYAPKIIREEVRKALQTANNVKNPRTSKNKPKYSRQRTNEHTKNVHRRGDRIWPKPIWIRQNRNIGRRNRGPGRARTTA